MNKSKHTINFNIVEYLYGIEFVNLLKYLNVTEFLDVNGFVKENKYYPCIGSIWIYGSGGSHDFYDNISRLISVHNGTLDMIDKNAIVYGNEYYKEHMGHDLLLDFPCFYTKIV